MTLSQENRTRDDLLLEHNQVRGELEYTQFKARQLQQRLNQLDQEIAALDRDQTPWCSAGHPTEASCDCGQIAENE